jgi:hypothetical protein
VADGQRAAVATLKGKVGTTSANGLKTGEKAERHETELSRVYRTELNRL